MNFKAQLNLFWWTFPMSKLSNTVNPRDYDSVLPSNASFSFTFDECHPIICCELFCHAQYRISGVCLFLPPLLMSGSLICFSAFLFYVFNWAPDQWKWLLWTNVFVTKHIFFLTCVPTFSLHSWYTTLIVAHFVSRQNYGLSSFDT